MRRFLGSEALESTRYGAEKYTIVFRRFQTIKYVKISKKTLSAKNGGVWDTLSMATFWCMKHVPSMCQS